MPTSLVGPDTQAILDAPKTPGAAFASPEDWRDQSIYFLMVDRFNNPAAPPVNKPFDDPGFSKFQGGKFSGVKSQLGYIKQLGAGAVWLSPVLKNLPFEEHTYHGYGIHDFLRAEPRLADVADKADDELRALVDAAHEQGLYVIFDIVLNHTGNVFAYGTSAESGWHDQPQPVGWRNATGAPPAAPAPIEGIAPPRSPDALVWPSDLQHDGFFRRQGGPDPNGDDTVGDFASLKQMRTDDSQLQSLLIRSYQFVIARYDIDGFRIDTLRYLKGDLARTFGNAIREYALSIGKKNFFTFGEVLDQNAEDDIARFIGRNPNNSADAQVVGVDAALDYPLFNTLRPMVKGFSGPKTVVDMYQRRKVVERDVLSSHGDATRYFVTFLDNHDMKERIRYIQPGDEHRFDDQVTLGLACLYCLPGIPCLYYGTEQGLSGKGNDEAVREALWGGPGFDTNNPFYQAIASIGRVRDKHPALRYGRFYFRPVSGNGTTFGISPFPQGVLAFSRILNDEEVTVVANTSGATQALDVIVDAQLNQVGSTPTLLYSNKANPTPPDPVVPKSNVSIQEVDGSVGTGPIHSVHVTIQPLEVQILGPATK
ncbi:MAG: alpha-amylase family glycosyl hydrolase [Actinomycetota bacterium]|nr:alpha-amylase family glycosyl hydrolase [Actinomycetota bacterium]